MVKYYGYIRRDIGKSFLFEKLNRDSIEWGE